MITVKHSLNKKIDEADRINVDLMVAMQEGLEKTREECMSKITEICPDRSHWFDVSIDKVSNNIKVSPTQDVAGDQDKIRYYSYLMDMHREDLAAFIQYRLPVNIKNSFKQYSLGGGNVY